MKRHLDHDVRVALATDVGAGTSFSLLNEGRSAYRAVLRRSRSPEASLGASFTLVRQVSVDEVRVAGRVAASRRGEA